MEENLISHHGTAYTSNMTNTCYMGIGRPRWEDEDLIANPLDFRLTKWISKGDLLCLSWLGVAFQCLSKFFWGVLCYDLSCTFATRLRDFASFAHSPVIWIFQWPHKSRHVMSWYGMVITSLVLCISFFFYFKFAKGTWGPRLCNSIINL